ncbi:hypothetical protein J3458_007070 [Metarhizium acridum]|uniref:uncharacterized protein n=1 Tax=Metarhizium acridum TaxID=92637 RepID=UPI001C6C42A7|nr:hypothetical protein J3458_007070 [Metarhizium acridum]
MRPELPWWAREPGFTSVHGFVPSYAPSVSSTSRAETRTMPLDEQDGRRCLDSCETGLKIYAALGGAARHLTTEGTMTVQQVSSFTTPSLSQFRPLVKRCNKCASACPFDALTNIIPPPSKTTVPTTQKAWDGTDLIAHAHRTENWPGKSELFPARQQRGSPLDSFEKCCMNEAIPVIQFF